MSVSSDLPNVVSFRVGHIGIVGQLSVTLLAVARLESRDTMVVLAVFSYGGLEKLWSSLAVAEVELEEAVVVRRSYNNYWS